MTRAVVPPGWPRRVLPPAVPGWEESAGAWLLDLCPPDYRGYPVLRIGVTDVEPGTEATLEIQDVFTVPVSELRRLSTETLPAVFGPTVSEPVA